MAEAPKKPPAKPGGLASAAGKDKNKGNPLLPVIGLGLVLGGAAWMTYSIITKPVPVKKKGGGN